MERRIRSRRPALFGIIFFFVLLAGAACGGGSSSPNPTVPSTATSTSTPIAASPTATATATVPAAPAKLGTYSGATTNIVDPSFTAISGATAVWGVLGKAPYEIEIPANWNHELVMFVHGFVGFTPDVEVQQPTKGLRQVLVNEGYAWAASGYTENGFTPGIAADDTLALKRFFVGKYGTPKHTYLFGESMGGDATALSLEHFPNDYDGAVSACGALGGEEEIDFLVSYAMAAQYVSGVTFPIGKGYDAVAGAVAQIPEVFGTVNDPTAKGAQFANVIRNLTGGPRPFFLEGLKDHELFDLALLNIDPNRQLYVFRAATNDATVYHIDSALGFTDAQINAGVQRLLADPAYRNAAAYPDAVPNTGNITKPLLTIHGTGDLFVPITNEISYHNKVVAAGKGDLLVQRAIRSHGHCQFTTAEYKATFDDMVTWVEQGKKPAGEDLTGDLSNAGMAFTTPLRDGDPGTK